MAASPIFLDEAIEELVDAVSYYETVAPRGTAQRLALEANDVIQPGFRVIGGGDGVKAERNSVEAA
ncbi:MAG: hypothetical protein RLZZ623_1214 [Actinomycetota bacterium]